MTYRFQAFLPNPDEDRPDNPIHSTAGGKQHGFSGALVGGIHVLGWTSGAFLQSLGHEWLDDGWVEVHFRKPVHDGDTMTVNLTGQSFTVTNRDCEVCLEGRVGRGDPPFGIPALAFEPAVPPAREREPLTLEQAPVGQPLLPMAVRWQSSDQEAFIEEWLRDGQPCFTGKRAAPHPAWLARQPIDLLHHSFDYGPAIHTSSQINLMSRAPLGQTFTVTGRCADAFEKRGHHYIVNDVSLWTEAEQEVARMRHTAIFRLRTSN